MKKFIISILTILMCLTSMPIYAEDDETHEHTHETVETEETTTQGEVVDEIPEVMEEGEIIVEESTASTQAETEPTLYCDKQEHIHNEDCFDNYRVLICEEKDLEHIHEEECYKTYSFLMCEKEEHIHDENCYDENYIEPVEEVDEAILKAKQEFEELLNKAINEEDGYFLSCEKIEHTHTPECFEYREDLICDKQEITDEEDENYHIHSDECNNRYYVISCEEHEEHTHTIECIKHTDELGEVEDLITTVESGIFDSEIDHSDIPADETIEEETPIRQLMRAPRLLGSASGVNIREFVVQQFYGGKMQSGKYTWDANYNTSGHRFSFRLNYALGGVGELDANSVVFTIPKQILRDRNNNFAGTYEMSIPSKRDVDSGEELDTDISFAYYEDGNDIKIYNFKPISAGSNGYIELSYITNKTATNYKDMGKSDNFVARMDVTNNEQTISSTSGTYNVYINTTAKISSVVKGPNGYPSRYSSWQSSWGTAPANANDYYYLVWTIKTTVAEPVTQPYNFTLQDTLQTANGEVIGYKFSGQSTYSMNNTITNQTSDGYRYDYVLTRHPKSYWQPLEHWSIKNNVTAIVDPVDQIDADTKASASQTYVWNKPVFTIPSGHFNSYKRADGNWRACDLQRKNGSYGCTLTYLTELGMKAGEYSRYDLDEFQDGIITELSNLDYAVWMRGYPYPWTYQANSSLGPKDPNNYGILKVKFELIDEGVYLYDEAAGVNENLQLDYNDFEIDTIAYSIRNNHVTGFNEETQSYIISSNLFDNNDILNFYGKFANGDWVKIATYKPLDKTTWFDSNYVESMTNSLITLKDNCIAYKVDTTNSHYYTEVNTVPNLHLKNSTKVMSFVQNKQSIGIYNKQTANFYKQDGTKILTTSEADSNFARVTQKDSYIFKDSVAATNNVKKKYYAISWKVGMTEQYIAGEGNIDYINQDSGVFYDLLPKGAVLDVNSVSVRAGTSSRYSNAVDTAEKMKNRVGQFLPSTAFTVEQIPDYKGTGRTLLIVRVKDEAKYYDVFFDTIHSWDSISDWGNDVYNPVAYETGNEKIRYGTNNDGGNIDEKDLMTNLPSDAQGEKFIYAQSYFDIATITAASTGLTKKVKALDDKDFSYDTITTNDGDYEYRWRIASSHTSKTKNIILFDSMENYVVEGRVSDWHGTIQSIDLSQPKSMGINPILYYSTIENLDIENNHDITDSSVWQRLTDQTDLSTVKALAADLRKTTSSSDFILEEGQSLSIILHMRAPHGAESQGTYPEAYNNIYLSDTVIGLAGTPQDFFIHQDYTTVRFVITEDLTLKKLSAEDETTPIKDIKFRLKGTSDYGTEEDRIVATDLKGEIVFKDIEKGSYILSEYEATVDWLLNPSEYVVTVDAEGVVSIAGQDNSNFVSFENNEGKYTLTLKDDPRIHGDVALLKRREGDSADDIEFKQMLANAEIGSEVEYDGKVYKILEKTTSKVRVKEIPQSEAYAVYDSSNETVTFFRDEPGKYTHNQVDGTKTYYTEIETTNYTSNPPWFKYNGNRTIILEDVISPISTFGWFRNSLEIIGLNKLDTSNVTNMTGIFARSKPASLDLSSFDTSNVTNMSHMFSGSEATSIDLSSFDTSKVTNMKDMFNLSRVFSLDLSSFDTSKVTDMSYMFYWCGNLNSIYVSESWNVNKVTRSDNMFYNCTNLPNYNSSLLDKTNANYGESGYLTHKPYTEPTPVQAVEGYWIFIELKPQTPISDTTFKLYGVSDYGTETTELDTTNTAGRVTFRNIELGTYTLEEVIPNEDYVLNTTKWTVKIDENGNASIIEPEDESLRDRLYTVEKVGNNYVIFNEPRYWNFTLRKIDKENETIWIQGAEFTLSGISDLGTEYNEVVESNENGRVIFERIEKGTYILKETKAPTGVTETGAQGGNRNYIADSKEYIVKIDNQGNVTVNGLNMNQYDDFVVKNDRAYDGKITIVKKWEDNLTNDERPEPVVHLSTVEPNWKRGITVTKVWEGDSAEDRPEDITVHLITKEGNNTIADYVKANMITNSGSTSLPVTVEYDNMPIDGANVGLFDIGNMIGEDFVCNPALEGLCQMSFNDTTSIIDAILDEINQGHLTLYRSDNSDMAGAVLFDNLDPEKLYLLYIQYNYNRVAPTYKLIYPGLNENETVSSLSGGIDMVSRANGWTKNPDNTWTYTFDILLEDENANKEFYVWEEDNVNSYKVINNSNNPVKVVDAKATVTNKVLEAYAVYDSSNETLTFFRDEPGKYTHNQADGTKTYYTNIETTKYTIYSYRRVPWWNKELTYIIEDEIFPISTAYWFYKAKDIVNLDKLNTSKVTTMSFMFGNSQATTLDLSNFNTSNVIDMSYMFYKSQATSLDLSSFDTSNVTDMDSMFQYSDAASLDLSSFNTSNVTNMGYMFCGSQATSLDLSTFDTSNVTNMNSMFRESNTASIVFPENFGSAATNMYGILSSSQATSLDLSNFNTSNVANMSSMFYASQVTSLDLSTFDTSSATDMSAMFYESKVTSLDLSNFNTSNVTNMANMFYRSWSLANIYVSDRWDTSNISSSKDMFNNCSKLPNFNSSYTDITRAHYNTGGYLTYKAYTPPNN